MRRPPKRECLVCAKLACECETDPDLASLAGALEDNDIPF